MKNMTNTMMKIFSREFYQEIGIPTTRITAWDTADLEFPESEREIYEFYVPSNDSDFHNYRLQDSGYHILSIETEIDYWSLTKNQREEVRFYLEEYTEEYFEYTD